MVTGVQTCALPIFDNLTTVWIKTNEQDATFCERGHLGISSPAYVPGPYAPTESQVDDFVTWYIERLKAHRDELVSRAWSTGVRATGSRADGVQENEARTEAKSS